MNECEEKKPQRETTQNDLKCACAYAYALAMSAQNHNHPKALQQINTVRQINEYDLVDVCTFYLRRCEFYQYEFISTISCDSKFSFSQQVFHVQFSCSTSPSGVCTMPFYRILFSYLPYIFLLTLSHRKSYSRDNNTDKNNSKQSEQMKREKEKNSKSFERFRARINAQRATCVCVCVTALCLWNDFTCRIHSKYMCEIISIFD